jgi:hypothetical protein
LKKKRKTLAYIRKNEYLCKMCLAFPLQFPAFWPDVFGWLRVIEDFMLSLYD